VPRSRSSLAGAASVCLAFLQVVGSKLLQSWVRARRLAFPCPSGASSIGPGFCSARLGGGGSALPDGALGSEEPPAPILPEGRGGREVPEIRLPEGGVLCGRVPVSRLTRRRGSRWACLRVVHPKVKDTRGVPVSKTVPTIPLASTRSACASPVSTRGSSSDV
jgi:hypothetical protein